MKKKQSAFEQSLAKLSNPASFAQQTAQTIAAIPAGFAAQALAKLESMKQRAASAKLAEMRRGKNSYPVANLKNGAVVYSDGTVMQTGESRRLDVLRKNVLDQHSFTPQAREYLESLPLDYQTPSNALGVYTQSYSTAPGKGPQRRIGISGNVFESRNPASPTEVMTHEFMHALDANVNGEADATYIPEKANSGDSYEFYAGLQAKAPKKLLKQISGFLNRYPEWKNQKEQQVADTEGFAQFGGERGENVLNTPFKNSYGNIFRPASQVQSYSPRYPVENLWNNLLKQLEEEGQFGG